MNSKFCLTCALILVIIVAIVDCQDSDGEVKGKGKGKGGKFGKGAGGGAGGGAFNKEFMEKKIAAMKEKCAANVANITACLDPSCNITDICADFKQTMTVCIPQDKRMAIFTCLKNNRVINIQPGMKNRMKNGTKARKGKNQNNDDSNAQKKSM